ncbi:MAG: autotransporter outer membrane beta-barrel domain-containing protein [Campylobacter sp.]|nr:autotransporter outer membrane beta-barrel domain-containing protein [Campylobacter sp.]
MKNHKFNNFSLVLATVLFGFGGVSFVNAAEGYIITGATKNGNTYDGSKGNSGNIVEIDKGDTTGQTPFDEDTSWVNGGNGSNNGKDVVNNTLKVTNVKHDKYPAYRGGYISGGSGSVLNNSIIIDNSFFRGVYGGLIQNNNNGKKANYNTVKVINSMVNSANNTAANFRAGSIENGSGDAEYNTLEISGSTIKAPETQHINISSGLLQNGSGNSRYNQIIISGAKTTIVRDVYNEERNVIFGGRIQNPNGTSQEIVGNRAYIQNLDYAKGNIVAGGSVNNSSGGSGVTLKDNIAVISGDTKLTNAYASWVKGLNNAKLSDNLIIVNLTPKENLAKISGNVYGSLNEANGGTSQNSAVYFMNGVVGGTVGGGNLANTGNKLILGDSSSNFGERKAGSIENFESLNFNVLQEGDKSKAVLSLTGSRTSSLDGVSIKFLDQSNGDSKEAQVLVGGSGGSGVNSLRDSGGGTNAIKALTQDIKYKQYNAKDEKIKITTLVAQNDIVENLLRNDQSTQATYNIGTKYSFAYKDLDLTEANKKYYLINSANSELTGYTNMKNYIDSTISGKGESVTHFDNTNGIVIDAYQTNQDYLIDNASTFTRNLRGMFVSDDKKALYITSNSDIKENIGTKIGGDDFFTKFGQSKDGNTISVTPNGNLDLSNTKFDGGTGKNTLNIGKDENNPTSMNTITMQDVINFDTINFYLPDPKNGDIAIKIADGSNTNVSNSKINVYIDDVSKFTSGKIHLLKADNGQVISDPSTVKVKAQIGAIAESQTNSLDLVYQNSSGGGGSVSTNDQTKIFSEARLGGLGALWQGQYLIANHLDRVIPDAFSELFPYAITEGYDKRFNTGSHVDTRGFNANAGFASKGANSSGEFTMGPFLDYGFSNYDAYLDDGTHGDGKNYYIGGGFFGKQENNSGSYFEATFRIGQLVTEFNGDLTLNGVSKNYDFDLKSTYYSFHAGLGKVYDLNANNNLDIYGRFFYTHIESADTTLNGTKTEFDAVQSKKIKLGFKDDYKFNENHAIYAGAAYEYEFDAKAGARLFVPGYNTQGELLSPSLKGSTGIGEIGYEYKNDKIKFDAGVKGYVGKQEGVSAQMAISIAF